MESTQTNNETESIETFLNKLKLADKYLQCFRDNNYSTVEECAGLTEQKLKEMGITLPGER